ncbi:hypothetical protein N9B82_03215 [Saprospiraceae bacterium]|nr:hypothetical protein [Saprospiraceae bacterium]
MEKLKSLIIIPVLFFAFQATAQFNVGIVSGYDLYQRYVNPDDGTGADRSAGNALISSALGLKGWVGSPKFSFSVEAYANLGTFAFNTNEYYGLGAISFPMLAKFNFNGASALNELEKFGFYFGGGYQINKTELYGINQKGKDRGIERPYFPIYVGEVGIAFGNKSKVVEVFCRYGWNSANPSNGLNIGVNTTYSIPFMKMPDFNTKPGEDMNLDKIFKL